MTRVVSRIAMGLLATLLAGPAVANDPKSPIDILREAIAPCWLVHHGVPWSGTSVTVAFQIARDGTPLSESLRLVADNGAPEPDRAFEAARRAILRCGAQGFPLAPGDYDVWRDVEITFDPRN